MSAMIVRYHSWPWALAASSVLLSPLAAAQSAESVMSLGAVSVSATKAGPLASNSVLSSVDQIGSDILEKQAVSYSWELFNRAPGVMLTQYGQGTTSGKISMRGFNGEGEVNAVKLLIDGIPSNGNDGNMPYMDMVFPLEIDSIEVVRGTNDPRYGLHNIAGNASINTLTGGNYGKARVRTGSFGLLEGQLVKGIEGEHLSQNYSVAYQQSDGYRDHADADRFSVSGKWFFTPDDGAYRLGLIARHYRTHALEPGYLDKHEAHQHPTHASEVSAFDKGNRQLTQISVHYDQELSDTLSWSTKAYLNHMNDERWVRFSMRESQQQRNAKETHTGALTALTWRPEVSFLYDLAIETGADFEHQDNVSQRWATVERVKQRQTRDQDFTLKTLGGYVQVVAQPWESLKIIPAYRVDRIRGDFTNELTGEKSPINDYGLIEQPKLSVVYTPIESLSLYGNWGRTFQVGTGATAYKVPPRTEDLAPSINDGFEVGVKFKPTAWLDGRIAYWEQDATDEVRKRLNDPSGDSENVGATHRAGYDAQLNLYPTDALSVWLAYSYQRSRIEKPDPALPASRGKQIDHIPNHLYSAGLTYQASAPLQLSAWFNGQSDYYLERENTQGKFGGFNLLNLGASYQLTADLTLDVQLKNVTNQYYEYVWHDGTQSLHAPGERRALHGGLTLEF